MLLHNSRWLGVVGLLAFAWLVQANRTQASGFLIYDMTAETLAKGSAVSASIEEPSAVWFNPAAMSLIPGYQAQAGGLLIMPTNKFTPADGSPKVTAESDLFFLPHLFGTVELADWVHAGIGACSPWGLGLEWPEEWVGREASIKSSLVTMMINPSVSFQVWQDRLSIGAGFSVIRATVDLTNGLPPAIGGIVRVGGGTWGYGGNVGVLFRVLTDTLHVAAAYRSRIKLSFEGEADFTLASEELGQELYDQGGHAEITVPDIITWGLMVAPTEKLVVGFDVTYTLWSVYEEMRLNFDSGVEDVAEKNWHNTFAFRLSADYALPLENLKLRGGVVFDQNPSPKETLAPDLPDSERLDFSIGAGYQYDWFKADLGYMFSWFLPAESTTGREGPEGEYNTLAHLIGVTLTVQFGTGDEDEAENPNPQRY